MISSDSSEDGGDVWITYDVKKRSGKVSKGVPNTSRIYRGNDSSESFGVTGNNFFGISGDDVGRGNS